MTVQRDDEELAALRYAVAHDLRAPLRAIEGFGEALAEEYGGRLGEEGADYLRRIRGANRESALARCAEAPLRETVRRSRGCRRRR